MKMMISVILTTIMIMRITRMEAITAIMTIMIAVPMTRIKTIIMTLPKPYQIFRNVLYPMEQFPPVSNCARRNYVQSIVP